MRDFSSLNQDSHQRERHDEEVLLKSKEKTEKDISNLSKKVVKMSSEAAVQEETHAKVIKLEASLESEMAEITNQKSQQDVKIEELIKKINEMESKLSDQKEMDEKIEELKALITENDTNLINEESKIELKSEDLQFTDTEIKLETEKQYINIENMSEIN